MKVPVEAMSLETNVVLSNINKLFVECINCDSSYEYAFHVYKNNKLVIKTPYRPEPNTVYWLHEPGEYYFQILVRTIKDKKLINYYSTESLTYNPIRNIYCSSTNKKIGIPCLRDAADTLAEIFINWRRMFRIARYEYKVMNTDSYLGNIWSYLNPLIQILTFWFVFGIGIRGGQPVGEYPYIIWMLCGIIPWFYISACIVSGAGSIYRKGATVLKFRYPMATIPVESVVVSFFDHIVMVGILVIMLLIMGFFPNLNWLNLIYYSFYTFFFLSSLSLITSVLTMIARDFQKLINALIRLLFYMTPILWSTDNLPYIAKFTLNLNPVLYSVNGFRDSLLYGVPFWEHMNKFCFFWAINLVLLVIGCKMQVKFRNRFIDLL